jgi:hypothetical protein
VLSKGYGNLPSMVAGNYINQRSSVQERRNSVSPSDGFRKKRRIFRPLQCLELPECRFRVMAWTALQRAHGGTTDERWDLLKAGAEPQVDFWHSLDLHLSSRP